MRIDLPWPAPILWPNGPRPRNHGHKASVTQKHRQWAHIATLEVKPPCFNHNGAKIPLTLEVHAKRFGPLPDEDNCIAACKAMLDGIADGLGVNDRDFTAPRVVFSPERDGRFVVIVGGAIGDKFSPQESPDTLEGGGSDTRSNASPEPDPDRIGGAS